MSSNHFRSLVCLLCIHQAFGGSLQVLHSPSGLSGHGETRHDHGALRQRLRGGWFAPLMPDVPSHQAPNLEPQDVRSMLRSPSTTSLTESSDKKARPGRWFARVATRLRRRQRQKPTGNTDDALKMSTCDELTTNTDTGDSSEKLTSFSQKMAVVRGGLTRTSEADVNSVCQSIVIEASLEECFSVASNYEEYPKWAAAVAGLQVLARTQCGLGELVEFEMGMFGITTKNKMKYSYERPGHNGAGVAVMKWHVTEGGVKELVGRYQFMSLSDSSTKVIYNLYVEPGFPLPDMIKKATNRAVAKAALNDLKAYAELVHQSALMANQEMSSETYTSRSEGEISSSQGPLKSWKYDAFDSFDDQRENASQQHDLEMYIRQLQHHVRQLQQALACLPFPSFSFWSRSTA